MAEARHAQAAHQRWVRFVADDNHDRRRVKEAIGLDVPAHFIQNGVARGKQRGEVRRRRAGDEASAGSRWQAERVYHPAKRDLFELGVNWRDGDQPGVLVPGGGQPARRDGGRERAADDEAEETRASGRQGSRRANLVQQSEHSAWIRLVGGEWLFKVDETSKSVGAGTHTALVQALPVAFGPRRRIVE